MSNKNESATVGKTQKFCKLNKARVLLWPCSDLLVWFAQSANPFPHAQLLLLLTNLTHKVINIQQQSLFFGTNQQQPNELNLNPATRNRASGCKESNLQCRMSHRSLYKISVYLVQFNLNPAHNNLLLTKQMSKKKFSTSHRNLQKSCTLFVLKISIFFTLINHV